MTTATIEQEVYVEQELTPTPFLIPTDVEGVYDLHVDNSSKELFETCARAAEYYSVQRREGIGERPAQFRGTVIHEACAIRQRNEPNWIKRQLDYIIQMYRDKDFGPDEWRTCEHAVNSIVEYNKSWPLETEPFTVQPNTVEMPFKIALGTANLDSKVQTHLGEVYVSAVNVYWTGIIDSIIDYSGLLVKDIKTTSVLGPTFFDDFVLSSQMHGYVWAARKLGYNCGGLMLDAIAGRKPTKSGKAHEYHRQRFWYTEEHLAEWERDTYTLITDFLEHLCRNYFPKSPKWCFGKYGRCQYWDVCSQIPQNREAMLQSDLYKPVTWNPLQPTPTI